MTNNQRFLAELAVLLTIGGAVYARAAPARQDKQPAVPEVLRARKFELVDKEGKILASLAQVNKRTVFVLGSREDKAALIVGAEDDVCDVMLVSPKQKSVIHITVDDTAQIRLLDKNDVERKITVE